MVLVTGATGFLGSYIVHQLIDKGYSVRALRRRNIVPAWIPDSTWEKVEWVDGDILDVVALQDAMEGVDIVIHCAAVVSFVKKDRARMYQANVEGTANVVNMALEKNVKRLVHISSVAALGRSAAGGHVDEEKKWEDSRINTHYAVSKHKAELHVWRGISEGLQAIILNPSTILGYGDWHSSSCAIFRQVFEGFEWYTEGINGFVDVEDCARATLLAMESDTSEQRFIINGDTWPFRQLQDTIAKAYNKKGPSKNATAGLLSVAAKVEALKSFFTGKRPLLTRESAKVALSKTWFENGKFLRAFPQFSYTPLEETVKKACSRYLADVKK